MALDRYILDWQLDTTKKWTVDRVIVPSGGTPIAKLDDVVEFESGLVIVNNKPWGLGTHKMGADVLSGLRIPDPFASPTVRLEIVRATCLICEVDPVTPPNQTDKFWIASQNGGIDYYDRDWKLGKGWVVKFLDKVTGVVKNKEVKITGADVVINGTNWGTITAYDAKSDTVTGTPNAGGTTFTIRRRSAMYCSSPLSGGNSWIAIEGGR